MYIVLKNPNYESPEVVMFTTKELAIDYLQKWWQDEYNTALAKSEALLYKGDTYHENDYARISWSDGAKIEFYVVKDSRPKEFI